MCMYVVCPCYLGGCPLRVCGPNRYRNCCCNTMLMVTPRKTGLRPLRSRGPYQDSSRHPCCQGIRPTGKMPGRMRRHIDTVDVPNIRDGIATHVDIRRHRPGSIDQEILCIPCNENPSFAAKDQCLVSHHRHTPDVALVWDNFRGEFADGVSIRKV